MGYYRNPPAADTTPVQITSVGNRRLVLTYEGTGEIAGLLVSEPLSKVLKEYSVTLAASLGPQKPRTSYLPESSSWNRDGLQVRPLKIVTYGRLCEGDAIADILGDAGLFFQRPEASEYDMSVRYANPMYLLRPGGEMPRVVDGSVALSGREQSSEHTNGQQLGEVEKSQVFRIFDESTGRDADVALDVKQSSRIISVLKE